MEGRDDLAIEIHDRVEGGFGLRVGFDPDRARAMVRAETTNWDELVRDLPSADNPEGGDRIPTLLFPFWLDVEPAWLAEAGSFRGRTFDTVIRLPHDERFSSVTGLTAS